MFFFLFFKYLNVWIPLAPKCRPFIDFSLMTLKNEYTLMKCFTNKCKMDCYIRSQLGYIVTSHSNKYVCNIKDCVEEDEHKMQIQYYKCKCEDAKCLLKYRIKNCIKSSAFEIAVGLTLSCTTVNKKDLKIRGIAALIKEKLSDMITASDDITPKRAHSRLIKQRKKSNEYIYIS